MRAFSSSLFKRFVSEKVFLLTRYSETLKNLTHSLYVAARTESAS
jgi:hypothetical protein